MKVFGLHRSIYRAARINGEALSEAAQYRLEKVKLFAVLLLKGVDSFEAAEHLMVSRSTLYRWQKKYRSGGPRALEPGSTRPKRIRQPQWSHALICQVKNLRRQYPMWGKAKLVVLLKRQGLTVSESTVGRIITYLCARGTVLPATLLRKRTRSKRVVRRKYALRLPKGLRPQEPGELIQLDTMTVNFPGFSIKQFTAYCPVAKWTVADAYRSASSHTAKDFLTKLLNDMPFPVKGIQVDGGSEFMKVFEDECKNRNLILYVLPPRSPKLNGSVERANGAWRYEFYWSNELQMELWALRSQIKAFQHIYNHIRPHQSLRGLTPAEYLKLKYPQAV